MADVLTAYEDVLQVHLRPGRGSDPRACSDRCLELKLQDKDILVRAEVINIAKHKYLGIIFDSKSLQKCPS